MYKRQENYFALENPSEIDIPVAELHGHSAKPSTERTKRLKQNVRYKHAAQANTLNDCAYQAG